MPDTVLVPYAGEVGVEDDVEDEEDGEVLALDAEKDEDLDAEKHGRYGVSAVVKEHANGG